MMRTFFGFRLLLNLIRKKKKTPQMNRFSMAKCSMFRCSSREQLNGSKLYAICRYMNRIFNTFFVVVAVAIAVAVVVVVLWCKTSSEVSC